MCPFCGWGKWNSGKVCHFCKAIWMESGSCRFQAQFSLNPNGYTFSMTYGAWKREKNGQYADGLIKHAQERARRKWSVRLLSPQSMEGEWTQSSSHQNVFVWIRKRIPPPWWVRPNMHVAYCIGEPGHREHAAHSCPMDGEGSAHISSVCRRPGGLLGCWTA